MNALDAKLGEAADSGLESRQPKAESQQTYIQWERSQMGLKQGDTSQLKPTAGRVVKGQPLPLHRWPSVTNWYILLTSNAGICGCVSKSGHFPAKPPLNIREIDQSIRFSIFIFTHTPPMCLEVQLTASSAQPQPGYDLVGGSRKLETIAIASGGWIGNGSCRTPLSDGRLE